MGEIIAYPAWHIKCRKIRKKLDFKEKLTYYKNGWKRPKSGCLFINFVPRFKLEGKST